MKQVNHQTGEMIIDEKIEILIAVGAAAASNCIPCFEHIYEKATTCGLTTEQIKRASDLAGRVKRGANASLSNSIEELLGSKEIDGSQCLQSTYKSCCG